MRENYSPANKLFLIVLICLLSVGVFSALGLVLSWLFYDLDMDAFSNYSNPATVKGLKLFQLLSSVGLFIVPPLVYGSIITSKKEALKFIGLSEWKGYINVILVFLLMLGMYPCLSWVIEWNSQITFPDFMRGLEQWMRYREADAEIITKLFLEMDGIAEFLYILLIVAIVPAIGEELLFRGVLQKILITWTKNNHVGIILTGILFSALHVQFFGFFPRMLLGVMFGYLFLWSKSLWVPVIAHFINNGVIVTAAFFFPEILEETEIVFFEENSNNLLFYALSLAVTAIVLYLIKKINKDV